MLFLIVSCNTVQRIPIQIAVPPQHPISSQIQSLVILNRSITRDFSNLDRDSLEKILVRNDLNLDTVILDSVAADTTIQVTAKALFQSDRFDVVVPKERDIQRKDTKTLLAPLDSTFINRIRKEFNVNAVLVLESFEEKVITDLKTQKYYMGYDIGRSINEYRAVFNVAYNLTWRLYQPDHNPPIIRFDTRDTIFWNDFDYSLRNLYEKLPSVKEALIDGGVAAGTDMAENISPKWVDETRQYYTTGKSEIDAAIPLLKDNKWEEAAQIWKKYAGISSKSLRSKIEFNLALASEMTGDLDSAIEWITKSYHTKYSHRAEVYLKYLEQRRQLLNKAAKNTLPG